MNSYPVTERTTLKRRANRGTYDRETVHAILDEAFICHVGFVVDGQPYVIPTAYARIEDRLYLHGSVASRMLRALAQGVDVCVTVTLVDGLVLARSAFHHSINYRSVVALGRARVVESESEKYEAMRALTEHVVPGRWQEVRVPEQQEMDATLVLCLPLTEASAKIRSGPPVDDESDLPRNVWAGVLPLDVTPGTPARDPLCNPEIQLPSYVRHYTRKDMQQARGVR